MDSILVNMNLYKVQQGNKCIFNKQYRTALTNTRHLQSKNKRKVLTDTLSHARQLFVRQDIQSQ